MAKTKQKSKYVAIKKNVAKPTVEKKEPKKKEPNKKEPNKKEPEKVLMTEDEFHTLLKQVSEATEYLICALW